MNAIVFLGHLFAVVWLQLLYFLAHAINLSDESVHSPPLK